MLFNSLKFLFFFPIVVFLYYVMPKKFRIYWLLAASYYFYMSWNFKYALLLFYSTSVTWLSGIMMDRLNKTGKKICVAGTCILNLAILFFFKYFNFLFMNMNRVLATINITLEEPALDIILPVGISFYTFQALSYTIDVYKGEIQAEKSFPCYALFVSFFPQLVAGPIERSKNLLGQIKEKKSFDFNRVKDGLLLMIWGYFLKIVLADRIDIVVNTVYSEYETYAGYYIIFATILFAFQIYCDFAGYSTIAAGAAEIMGFRLMDNFNAPYLAVSVDDFWRRWHISLSSWFKDYLYIPLGGNRKGKWRKYFNLLVVFGISGLWHGAGWNYVMWGILNGFYQVAGNALQSARNRFVSAFHITRSSLGHRALQTIITFILIDFSWIFFRANKIGDAFKIVKSMFAVHNPWILFDDSLYQLGIDHKSFQVMVGGIVLLLFADVLKYKKICVREIIQRQDVWVQCMVISVSVVLILIIGIWGPGYTESSFIYFQF